MPKAPSKWPRSYPTMELAGTHCAGEARKEGRWSLDTASFCLLLGELYNPLVYSGAFLGFLGFKTCVVGELLLMFRVGDRQQPLCRRG